MKRDIYYIDWAESNSYLYTKMLKANSSWVLPQLTALLGKLPLARGDNELISPTLSFKRIAREIDSITFSNGLPLTKEALNNILKFVIRTNRSDILTGTQLNTPRYSAAVPFVFSAFKEQRNIQYSGWDTSDPGIKFFLEPDWVEALAYADVPMFMKDDLLDFRAKARTFRSGAKAGSERSINATTSITRTGVLGFDELPKYWKLALCQTWVFHPSNRHPLAITDPYNIDEPAEPLVSGEIFETKQASKGKTEVSDWGSMWENV